MNLDNPRYFPEKFAAAARERIRARFAEENIGLCFHAPTDIPLMNRHESIRRAGQERMRQMIDMAVEMGGEYFIFHPGRLAFYSLSSKKIFFMEQRYPERVSAIFAESLDRLVEYCADRIKLCIENTHTVAGPFLKVIERTLAAGGLGLVWDVGHVEQLADARRRQMLKFFQDNVRYVRLGHLHDVKGELDHKSLGSGRLDISGYLEIFRVLSLDIILEIFPEEELLKSLEYVRKSEMDIGLERRED